ncbi:MAG TPA: vitamin K epoxide reductase family protein [Ignavibacteriaceae bacterium]|nr:vitamin K epoxide reductase family protein [Ignavibacteriaceae bacterium]
MVTHEDSKNLQISWPFWRFILLGLNILALILSTVLSWHYLQGGSMIGCSGGSPCNQVLNSPWSMIAGILPVTGLSAGVYLAIMVASFYIGPTTETPVRRIAWSAMLMLAGSVAGSAVWFTIIQKWIIGDFCLYCLTTHITGLLLAALVIWRAMKELNNYSEEIPPANPAIIQNVSTAAPKYIIRPFSPVILALIGVALAGVMAAFQIVFTPAIVYREGHSQNIFSSIDYHSVPIIGSPDAPYTVTFLFDYQCSHCQRVHLMLDETIRRFRGKLAFALCPAPLNSQCNPYIPGGLDNFKNSCELAEIGLAVWLANRGAYSSFDNWMFTFESGDRWYPRSLESARTKAVELVGQSRFDAARTDPWIGQYMHNSVQIYGQTIQNGRGGVPKLIFGSHWIIPGINKADDLVRILQNNLKVPMH